MEAAIEQTTRNSDRSAFRNTGLSDRTVKILRASGIETPGKLLSVPPDKIAVIPGIGKVSLGEIMRYRERQQPPSSMATGDHQPSCFAMEEEKGETISGQRPSY